MPFHRPAGPRQLQQFETPGTFVSDGVVSCQAYGLPPTAASSTAELLHDLDVAACYKSFCKFLVCFKSVQKNMWAHEK